MDQSPELSLVAVELTSSCRLHPENINIQKFWFDCSYKEDLPSSIGNIEKLIPVAFSCACTDIESVFGSICSLQHLTKLTLAGTPEVPKDLERLQCLEELTLKFLEIKHLPDNICMLKHLKILKLQSCRELEKFPEDVHRLERLETLMLEECTLLRDIPNNICRMKRLKHFSLFQSWKVFKLPEELRHLACLKMLNVAGTSICHLPHSILSMEKGLKIVVSESQFPPFGFTYKMATTSGIRFYYRNVPKFCNLNGYSSLQCCDNHLYTIMETDVSVSGLFI